jgi:hypothetical protein
MLLDSRESLVRLHGILRSFLALPSVEIEGPAEQTGNPAPYEALLPGLRVRKSTWPIVLRQMSDGWLKLEGSAENLLRYVSYFYFRPEQESGHHHPENCHVPGYLARDSMKLIIEADSTWGDEGAV